MKKLLLLGSSLFLTTLLMAKAPASGLNDHYSIEGNTNNSALLNTTKWYVNDNSLSGDVFTSAIGNDANSGAAAAPFATITNALSVAAAGDTIYVDAGTYTEQVTITKGITIIGAGQNLTTVTNNPAVALLPAAGSFTELGLVQTVQNIGDVYISNISVIPALGSTPYMPHCIVIQSGGSVKGCKTNSGGGGGQGVFFRIQNTIKSALIENNNISAEYIAINCEGSGLSVTLLNNTINIANPGFSAGAFIGADGAGFSPLVQFTAMGNFLTGYVTSGFQVYSSNATITQNSFLGSGLAIQQYASSNLLNATCNWYGTTNTGAIASKISGNITYSPWLSNGTDNSSDPGFQPTAGSCSGRQKFYVNDNSLSGNVFTTAVGNNNNSGGPAAPFATITKAVSVAIAGDTIFVDAGTYTEQVTINKEITIVGAGKDITSVLKPAIIVAPPGTFTEPGVIQTTQNIGDVNISGLTVVGDPTGVTPIILQTGGSVKNCKAQNGNQGIYFRVESAIKTAVIENNIIDAEYIGVNVEGLGLTVSLINNIITANNPGFSAGVFAGQDLGSLPGFTATGNSIANYSFAGMLINSFNPGITQNSITGAGGFAIQKTGGNTINATCNWYGAADVNNVIPKLSGGVNFTPWLTNGTDNDPAIGFQPLPNSCTGAQHNFYVNDNSLSGDNFTSAIGNNNNSGIASAPLATITAALSRAQAGDTIIVDAGSYTEQVIITKSITLRGAGRTLTFINGPATSLISPPNFGEKGIIQSYIGIGDVVVENLLVDGTNSDEQHSILIQGGGRISNCEMRNANNGFFFRDESGTPSVALANNNYIHNISFVGALFAGYGMRATATSNVIDLNGAIYGMGFIAGYGGNGNLASYTATNNSVINFNGFGMMVGSLQPAQIHNNSITRITGNIFQNVTAVNIDATCNWYGTSAAEVIIPNMIAPVTYGPWLTNGTDNSTAPGFQPVPNTCNGVQHVFYVNDNNQSGDLFTTATGNNANTGVSSAPLATITAALSKAQEGDTIYVDAGNYTEQVIITKGITIIGAGQSTTSVLSPTTGLVPAPGPFTEIGLIETTQGIGDVYISNLTVISNTSVENQSQSIIIQSGGSVKNCTLINGGQGIFFRVDPAVKTAVAENNIIEPLAIGINCQGSGLTATVLNNTISLNNPNFSAGVFAGLDFGPLVKFTASGNFINNYSSIGFLANSTNTQITENSITGTGQYAFMQFSGAPTIANCNWYGTMSSSAIAAKMSGAVVYTPFLLSGTDDSPNPGFQPVAGTCGGYLLTATVDNYNNVSCNGAANGSINITVSGGVAPYSFAWTKDGDPGFSASTEDPVNLGAGTYHVTITDAAGANILMDNNGVAFTINVTITEPQILAATATGTNVNCFGNANGSASVAVTGGTAPYTYSWNNGATTSSISNLVAGVYSVTVTDAHECSTTTSYEVTQPAVLTASATGNNVSCFGGSNGAVQANVSGGRAPYTFLWSNTAVSSSVSGLTAGTYSVTVTDANGCSTTASYTVSQPVVLSVTITGTTASCNGSATAVPAGGTAPYTYLWNNGAVTPSINSVPAGIYTVTVTDANGCTVTKSFTITGNSPINPTATSVPVSCFGLSNGSITVTGATGTAPFTYNINGAAFQTSNIFSGLPAGVYVVGAKSATGCIDFVTRTIIQPAAVVVVLDSTRKTCSGVNGGRIYITATGGTGAKTYSWIGPNGFISTVQDPINLAVGTYNVIVTDTRGCAGTLSVVVADWPAISLIETVTNIACRGDLSGAINVSVNGGTSTGFIYSWTGPGTFTATTKDISGLRAGNYTLRVTDAGSGCSVTKIIAVTQPASIVSVTAATTAVNGCIAQGTITATGAGGTAPYQYRLNTGTYQSSGLFTDIAGGTYTVWVKDNNGCTAARTVTVTDNGSDGFETNNSKTQAKSVSLGSINSARIAIPADVADWFKFTVPAGSNSYTISLSHPSASFEFLLYPSANNLPSIIPADSSSGVKTYILTAGTYYIKVTGGLSFVCYQFSVNNTVPPLAVRKSLIGISDVIAPEIMTAKVYPNPHQGAFTLSIAAPESGKAILELYNATGQKVMVKEVILSKGNNNNIQFTGIKEAILFYKVSSGKWQAEGKIIGQY